MHSTFEVVYELRAALHDVRSDRDSGERRLQQAEHLDVHLPWDKNQEASV